MPFSSASWALGWGSRRGSVKALSLDFLVAVLVGSAGVEALRFTLVTAFFGSVRKAEVDMIIFEIRGSGERNRCFPVKKMMKFYGQNF
jgi:hypothetical protein